MKLIALTSNWNLEGIWNKNPQFYQSPVSSHYCTQSVHHLQTKAHSITLTTHTNENKQFWPMYKVMIIIKIWKYNVFSEKLVNSCI